MINHNKICNIEEVTEKLGNIVLSQLEYNVVRNAIPLHVLNQTICQKRDFTIYLDNRPLKHMKLVLALCQFHSLSVRKSN